MAAFFTDLLEKFSGIVFWEKVCKKFYYEKERITELGAVAEEMLPWIQGEAFWERRKPDVMDGRQIGIANGTYEAFCILPKKSVVFVAELTQDMQIHCESICEDCHNVHCPNRVEEDQSWKV